MTSSLCPCSSQKTYSECCLPLIKGEKYATTPEALMRSRYTAFTEKNIDYLFNTMTADLQEMNDLEDLRHFSEQVESWIKLEIMDAPILSSYATEGQVEFTAHFMHEGKTKHMHENSRFIKINGRWLYAGHDHQCGSHHHSQQHNHHSSDDYSDSKISRNGPCPCDSGKKYKKCCGK